MSPDDIFAANMWPWPDPMVKRDAMGRIIFVNVAFLQLYGGRVENWTGQVLQGWAQPKPQGMAYRFETRAGSQPNEVIYDWVEITMGDGNALAIARDITLFRKTPTPPQDTQFDAAPQQTHSEPAPEANIAPQNIPFNAPLPAPIFQEQEPQVPVSAPFIEPELPPQAVEPAPVVTAPVQEAAPAPEPEFIEAPAPEPESPQIEAVNTPAPAPQAEPVMAAEPQVAPEISSEPAPEPEPVPEPTPQAEAPRDFERRALPIENNDAVLGSNWRDAVIAKAIGASDPSDEDGEAQEAIAAQEASDEANDGESSRQSLRILLAEDNAINALLTRTLLEAEGCSVETVEDGALAVKAAEANSYDLVFMDMRMPNMDGLEATRKIRALGKRTEKLPIIALTANAFDDDRNACFDSGMNDFMTKPVSAEELSEMVATWTKKIDATKEEKSA